MAAGERKRTREKHLYSSERTPLLSSTENYSSVNIEVNEGQQEDGESKAESISESNPETPFSFKLLPSRKKWTFCMMAFSNFIACICFSLLAPFFPAEASKKGASQTVTGIIFSCFELVIFLSAPFYGRFLTRIGARFLFISGLFVCGGCAILFGTLHLCPHGTIFIVMCFLVRTVEALAASAFVTSSFAIIADEFPGHVSTVFGALETFSGLGLMVGPPIGGALYELGGFGLPFWVMGSLLVCGSAMTMVLLPDVEDKPRLRKGSLLGLLTNPLVIVSILTIGCGSFSLGFLEPTLAGHLDQFNLRTVYVGLIFVIEAALYAVTAPFWGYLSDTKGFSYPLVIFGSIVSCVGFLMIGPSPLLPFLNSELWLVIVSLVLMGLGIGCALVPTLRCLLIGARHVGYEDNLDTFGLVSGLFNSAFSFGTFIGPTVGSVIEDYKGFGFAATVTAAMFGVSAVFFSLYVFAEKTCLTGLSEKSASGRETQDGAQTSETAASYKSLTQSNGPSSHSSV